MNSLKKCSMWLCAGLLLLAFALPQGAEAGGGHKLTLGPTLKVVGTVDVNDVAPGTDVGVVTDDFRPVYDLIFEMAEGGADRPKYERDDDGVYHFAMPAADVTVSADYAMATTSTHKTVFTIGQSEAKVIVESDAFEGSNETQRLDAAPYIKNGRTMLPLRFAAEKLHMRVDFDAATRNVTVTRARDFEVPKRVVVLNLDSNAATVDGQAVNLMAKPEVVDGRTMLPVGEIADLMSFSRADAGDPLGYIGWNPDAAEVTLIRKIVVPMRSS